MLATPNALRRPDATTKTIGSIEEIDEEENSTSPHYDNDRARIGMNKSDTSLNVLNGLDIANTSK